MQALLLAVEGATFEMSKDEANWQTDDGDELPLWLVRAEAVPISWGFEFFDKCRRLIRAEEQMLHRAIEQRHGLTNRQILRLDKNGLPLSLGDTVMLIGLPPFLTQDLPDTDVRAIQGQVGKTHEVVGFNELGWIELEFQDDDKTRHTIWVEGEHLSRTDP